MPSRKKECAEMVKLARYLYSKVASPAFKRANGGKHIVAWDNASVPTKAGMFAIAKFLLVRGFKIK